MRALAAAALLLLAACASATTQPPTRSAPLVPTQTGVDVPGTGREIGFGRSLPGARAALDRLYGPSDALGCAGGGTVLLLADGLELHFPAGTFTGWRQGEQSAGRLCA